MPTEASQFDVSSKMLLAIFKKIEMKNAATNLWRIPQIDDHLLKVSNSFEQLQVAVEGHLDYKRQKFYRLYLLTNEEMLDMLANYYKNVNVFNTYISKMFDSVSSIKLVEEAGDHFIVALVSYNGEALTFPNIAFQSKGSLEEVMDQLL